MPRWRLGDRCWRALWIVAADLNAIVTRSRLTGEIQESSAIPRGAAARRPSQICFAQNWGKAMSIYVVQRQLLGMIATLALAFGASAQGIIGTVAGGGPDGVPAMTANLNTPSAIVTDANSNTYIEWIRQVS